jgi:hypothetical protein
MRRPAVCCASDASGSTGGSRNDDDVVDDAGMDDEGMDDEGGNDEDGGDEVGDADDVGVAAAAAVRFAPCFTSICLCCFVIALPATVSSRRFNIAEIGRRCAFVLDDVAGGDCAASSPPSAAPGGRPTREFTS